MNPFKLIPKELTFLILDYLPFDDMINLVSLIKENFTRKDKIDVNKYLYRKIFLEIVRRLDFTEVCLPPSFIAFKHEDEYLRAKEKVFETYIESFDDQQISDIIGGLKTIYTGNYGNDREHFKHIMSTWPIPQTRLYHLQLEAKYNTTTMEYILKCVKFMEPDDIERSIREELKCNFIEDFLSKIHKLLRMWIN